MVTLELTDEDAALFVLFRKHQDQFQVLEENGVFEPLVGHKVIHKDGSNVRMIETVVIRRI